MAMSQINIEDEQAARNWLRQAEALNNRTEAALKKVATDLQELSSGAEGDIISMVVDWSNRVTVATTDVMKGMNGLLTVVNDVLSSFSRVTDALVDKAHNLIDKLF